MSLVLPARTALQLGVLNLGSPTKRIKEIIVTAPTLVEGQDVDTRRIRLVEMDGNGQLVAERSMFVNDRGHDLPANTPVVISVAPYTPNGSHVMKLVSEPLGAGLAHPELGLVLNYEE